MHYPRQLVVVFCIALPFFHTLGNSQINLIRLRAIPRSISSDSQTMRPWLALSPPNFWTFHARPRNFPERPQPWSFMPSGCNSWSSLEHIKCSATSNHSSGLIRGNRHKNTPSSKNTPLVMFRFGTRGDILIFCRCMVGYQSDSHLSKTPPSPTLHFNRAGILVGFSELVLLQRSTVASVKSR